MPLSLDIFGGVELYVNRAGNAVSVDTAYKDPSAVVGRVSTHGVLGWDGALRRAAAQQA